MILKIGKDFNYEGFPGLVTGLVLSVGTGSYVHDAEGLADAVKFRFPMPFDEPKDAKLLLVQDDVAERKTEDAVKEEAWPEEHEGQLEYSIFGWYRYIPVADRDPVLFIMRLTNNEPEYRTDYQLVGDRTLGLYLGTRDYIFATYTLGNLDSESNANIKQTIPFNSDIGIWTYLWFGYNWQTKVANGFVQFIETDKRI